MSRKLQVSLDEASYFLSPACVHAKMSAVSINAYKSNLLTKKPSIDMGRAEHLIDVRWAPILIECCLRLRHAAGHVPGSLGPFWPDPWRLPIEAWTRPSLKHLKSKDSTLKYSSAPFISNQNSDDISFECDSDARRIDFQATSGIRRFRVQFHRVFYKFIQSCALAKVRIIRGWAKLEDNSYEEYEYLTGALAREACANLKTAKKHSTDYAEIAWKLLEDLTSAGTLDLFDTDGNPSNPTIGRTELCFRNREIRPEEMRFIRRDTLLILLFVISNVDSENVASQMTRTNGIWTGLKIWWKRKIVELPRSTSGQIRVLLKQKSLNGIALSPLFLPRDRWAWQSQKEYSYDCDAPFELSNEAISHKRIKAYFSGVLVPSHMDRKGASLEYWDLHPQPDESAITSWLDRFHKNGDAITQEEARKQYSEEFANAPGKAEKLFDIAMKRYNASQ